MDLSNYIDPWTGKARTEWNTHGTYDQTIESVLKNIPDPSRDGYIFDGWYTSPTGGTKLTGDIVFKGPMEAYAHWK